MNIKRFFENLKQMIEWNLISVLLDLNETGTNEYKSRLINEIHMKEIIFYDTFELWDVRKTELAKPKLILYSINLTCMDKTFISILRLSLTF